MLTTANIVPAMAAGTTAIQVSSCKGNTLEDGERSGLTIGLCGTNHSVTSSDPDTVTVEHVLIFSQGGGGRRSPPPTTRRDAGA